MNIKDRKVLKTSFYEYMSKIYDLIEKVPNQSYRELLQVKLKGLDQVVDFVLKEDIKEFGPMLLPTSINVDINLYRDGGTIGVTGIYDEEIFVSFTKDYKLYFKNYEIEHQKEIALVLLSERKVKNNDRLYVRLLSILQNN